MTDTLGRLNIELGDGDVAFADLISIKDGYAVDLHIMPCRTSYQIVRAEFNGFGRDDKGFEPIRYHLVDEDWNPVGDEFSVSVADVVTIAIH